MNSVRQNYTPQQQAALESAKVSVGLSAGAGCGKTFVLTQRFLSHLSPGSGAESLSKIVAITFTERAAREMRDRIRAECHKELEHCPDVEVPHWQLILRGLDSARISTFHSFCSSLLRGQAVEAGIDPAFEILEESTGRAFRTRIVSTALNELLSQQDEDCMQLVLHYGLERTRDLLRELVRQFALTDFSPSDDLTAEELADCWRSHWHTVTVPLLLQSVLESPHTIQALELLQDQIPNHKEMQRRRAVLLADLPRLAEASQPEELLIELRKCAAVQGGGGKKAWSSEEIYEDVRDALKELREVLKKAQEKLLPDDAEILTAAEFSLQTYRVTARIHQQYEQRKRELGYLDFDDLMIRTVQLLRESEIVRNRAAQAIDFLMVDEFQDTDPLQTEIVRHLCGDQLHTGKLFFVGDAKQSIYRFRRADPSVFAQLRSEIPESGRLPLSINFRSQPAILNFVNTLFAPAMGDQYEPLLPFENVQHSPLPAIEFLFATEPGDEEASEEKESSHVLRQREAEWIARRIQQLLSDPTPRIRQRNPETNEIELRRPLPGDMVLLFRSLSNIALYEDALRKFGLEYYLVGGRAFYAQQEIFDLANLCQYLEEPGDQVSLVGVLRSPFFSLTDDTLFALHQHGGSVGAGLALPPPEHIEDQQRIQVQHAAEVLDELRSVKDRLPLTRLLNLAIERTGYDASLVNEFLGRRKLANLRKLIELARQFDQSGLFTLKDFAIRLRESVSEQADEALAATHPETSDVIRLMTIHQSKGLEFPVVFVTDLSWKNTGGQVGPVIHPKMGPLLNLPSRHGTVMKHLGLEMYKIEESPEEERETERLLYVATTRAADYLILSAGMKFGSKPGSAWLKLLAARFDLETGMLLHPVDVCEAPDIAVHHSAPECERPEKNSSPALLPLEQFREAVETADTVPLPATLQKLSPYQQLASLIHVEDCFRKQRYSNSPELRQELSRRQRLLHTALETIDLREDEDCAAVVQKSAKSLLMSEATNSINNVTQALQAFQASSLREELAEADAVYLNVDYLLRWPLKPGLLESQTLTGRVSVIYQTSGNWQVARLIVKSSSQPVAKKEQHLLQLLGWLDLQAVSHFIGEPVTVLTITHLGYDLESEVLKIESRSPQEWETLVDKLLQTVSE